jgi:hypothetical protein
MNREKHSNIVKAVSFQSPLASTGTTTNSSSSRDLGSSGSNITMSGGGAGGGRLERPNVGNRHSNEYNFRLIAPKQKHKAPGSSSTARGRSKLRGRVPQKLRFHMTTVVTKQKKVPEKSSMTVESPHPNEHNYRLIAPKNASSGQSSAGIGTVPAVENTITRSPNVYSSVPLRTAREDAPGKASPPPPPPPPSAQVEEVEGRLKNGTRINGTSHLSGHRAGSSEDLHTAASIRQKDSLPLDPQSKQPMGPPRHRGRTTRSYTRRKRELTFHLYEDPGTAFRAKRACKEC